MGRCRWTPAAADPPLARTGRGGIHVLVAPTGIGRGRDLVLDGVHVGELKSTGGLIVVCPSVTVAAYRWLRSPEAQPLAPAPGPAVASEVAVELDDPRSAYAHGIEDE